jgi:hypothetical protein
MKMKINHRLTYQKMGLMFEIEIKIGDRIVALAIAV